MSVERTILRIDAAMRGNRAIYWLGRVPLIRRLVPDRLYRAKQGKLALSALLWLFRAVKALVTTALYLGLGLILPLYVMLDTGWELASSFGAFCWLLLVLSFGMGTLIQPRSVEPSQLKFTCVRLMGMDARRYQRTVIAAHHLAKFAAFTPLLMAAVAVMGQHPLTGLLLSLELALFRPVGEWFHVWLYGKTGVVLGANTLYIILFGLLGLCGAYLPVLFLWDMALLETLTPQVVLLHPAVPVVLAALALACSVKLARYPGYYRLVVDTSRPEQVSAALVQQKAADAQVRRIQLRDSDLSGESPDSGLSGWPCFQALFFRRHRRLLLRPVKIAVAIVAAVTAAAAILLLIVQSEDTAELFSLVPRCLPYCVFLIYLMDNTVGARICKAMFYNCDLAMLRYGWYRRPNVVLKNFLLRLGRLCGVNLLLSAAVCAMFTVMTLCAGGRPPAGEYLIFLAALLCLGVFFAVHNLGMYYLFQPYASDLREKNPLFSVLNIALYILCYLCFQIKSPPSWFTLLVLAVTLVYSGLILLLVRWRAPRTFRVK